MTEIVETHQHVHKPSEIRFSHPLTSAQRSITPRPPLSSVDLPKTPCSVGACAAVWLEMNSTKKTMLAFRGASIKHFLINDSEAALYPRVLAGGVVRQPNEPNCLGYMQRRLSSLSHVFHKLLRPFVAMRSNSVLSRTRFRLPAQLERQAA